MGSKKHKKHHKSEKKEPPPVEDRVEKPLRLVLKVSGGAAASSDGMPSSDYIGDTSTIAVKQEPPPPYQESEPIYYSEENADTSTINIRLSSEKHKKSKKKKKKKSSDKEKKHKHHRRHHHHRHHHHHSSEKKLDESGELKKIQLTNEDSNQGSMTLGDVEAIENPDCPPVEEMDIGTCSIHDSVIASPISECIDKTDQKSLQILLTSLFNSLQKKDLDQFFAWPVSDVIAPGYSAIIQNPMDFSTMKQKIDKQLYSSIDEFKTDVKLICDNCMEYNRPETVYFKAAKKLLHAANKMMSLDKLLSLKKSLIMTEQLPSDEPMVETLADPAPSTPASVPETPVPTDASVAQSVSPLTPPVPPTLIPPPPTLIPPPPTLIPPPSTLIPPPPTVIAPPVLPPPVLPPPVLPPSSPSLSPAEPPPVVEEEPPAKKMKPSSPPSLTATVSDDITPAETPTPAPVYDPIPVLEPEPPAPTAAPLTTVQRVRPVLEIENKTPEDIEAEQILLQAQGAARCAAEKLTLRKPKNNLAYLSQKDDGTAMLNIINPGTTRHSEREMSFGMSIGKLKSGTGSLNNPQEDKRNVVKPVTQLDFGSYSSFAPSFDSAFANLNKEETNLIYSTYGDELGVQYARSILRFTENGNFALDLAEKLLSKVTNGNHKKVSKLLNEKKKSMQQKEVSTANDKSDLSSDLGTEENNEVQQKLDRNAKLLQDLKALQYERLSQRLPSHLSHVAPISEKELQLASQLQDQLKELAMQAAPMNFVDTNAVRKAMGAMPI